MKRFLRCCSAILLGVTSMPSAPSPTTASAAQTIVETLSVTFLTPSLGWRATDRWNPGTGAGGPLSVSRTDDGGIHFHAVSSVPGAGYSTGGSFNVYASRALFADRHDGWLYGNRLYATHDGGHTWRLLPLHGSQTALSVSGASVWRLDSSCSTTTGWCHFSLLTSAVGSNTWHVMAWHPPRALAIGWSLTRADLLHAWLTGGPFMVKNHLLLRLLGTRDGGRTWQSLAMPCSRNGAGSMDAQLVPYTWTDLWVFCASEPSAGSQPKAIYRSSDGGHSWSAVASSGSFGDANRGLHNLTISGYLANAIVTTPSQAWLALSRGTLMHTADGGRTWHPAIPYSLANPGDGGVGPVQFVNVRHGWLFSFPHLLFRTTDAGQHWQTIRLDY